MNYRGPLSAASRSNNRREHKHCLRQHFHKQLSKLYQQPPLASHWKGQLADPASALRAEVHRSLGPFEFIPMVHAAWFLAAGLRITLLRPEPPGKIVTQGGDLDNRLKTLLDALKMPDEQQLPGDAVPQKDELPFICLLQEDSLVTSLDITTGRLLDPKDDSEVLLLIDTEIQVTRYASSNMVFLTG
jgi:hypothetical protein